MIFAWITPLLRDYDVIGVNLVDLHPEQRLEVVQDEGWTEHLLRLERELRDRLPSSEHGELLFVGLDQVLEVFDPVISRVEGLNVSLVGY